MDKAETALILTCTGALIFISVTGAGIVKLAAGASTIPPALLANDTAATKGKDVYVYVVRGYPNLKGPNIPFQMNFWAEKTTLLPVCGIEFENNRHILGEDCYPINEDYDNIIFDKWMDVNDYLQQLRNKITTGE